MRFSKSIYIFVALSLFTGIAFLLPAPAQAQTSCTVLSNGELNRNTCSSNQVIQYDNCLAANARDTNFCRQSLGVQAVTDSQGNTTVQPANTKFDQAAAGKDLGCSFTSGVGISMCLSNIVYVFTVGIGSTFAYMAALFFDFAIYLSLNSGAYALDFISQGWELARDLANMAFIFILIYIALTVMLRAETSDTIKTLAIVVVVALLVNFSFFFTRVVIDAGNLLAVQFYNAIPARTIAETTTASGLNPATSQQVTLASNFTAIPSAGQAKDLTHGIMQMMNLGNLFKTDGFKKWATDDRNGFMTGLITLSFLYIAAGIFFWGLVVTFITVGVKFLMRIVVLWFLIIASPLAFVARALPEKFGGWYDRWQSELIKHAFYPVAFMFVFFILSLFSKEMGTDVIQGIFAGGGDNVPAAQELGIAIANTAIRLGFVIGVLYIGMRASDAIGVMGADMAEKLGKRAGGLYTGTFKKAGGLAFSYSAGLIAQKGAENMKKTPPKTRLGQYLDFKWRDKVLKPIAGASLGGVASYTDMKKSSKERKTDWNENIRNDENRKLAARVKPIIDKNIAAGEKAEKGMDAKDMERIQALDKRQMGALNADSIKALSHVVKESQMKVIKDLENISEKEKDEAEKNWNNHSPHSDMRHAQKEIELLREISHKVGGIPTLAAKIGSGVRIKENDIADIKKALDDKYTEEGTKFEVARQAGDAALMSAISATRRTVNEGLNHTKEFRKKFEKIGQPEIIAPK